MAEWLVELQGDPADLEELADQFDSARLSVRKEGESQDRRRGSRIPMGIMFLMYSSVGLPICT